MRSRGDQSYLSLIVLFLVLNLFVILSACGGGGGSIEPYADPYNTSTSSKDSISADSYAMLGNTVSYTVPTTDLTGTSFTFSILDVNKVSEAPKKITPGQQESAALLANIYIDTYTGVITWVPPDTGYFEISVRITNERNDVFSKTITVYVIDPQTNTAPVIAEISPQTASVNQAIMVQVTATDEDSPIIYSLTGDAPSGALIDSSGRFIWTPSYEHSSATHYIVVQATDKYGAFSYMTFMITVGNTSPYIDNIVTQPASAGSLFSYTLIVSDNTPPYTFELINPPAGMTINSTGTITWTPSATTDAGKTFTITAKVTDVNGDYSTKSFTILVSNQAPVITAIADQTLTAGVPFSYDVIAQDPNPVSYALSNAPTGMIINTVGKITWSPAVPDEGWIYPRIRVTATDAFGEASYEEFNVFIQPSDQIADILTPFYYQLNVNNGTAPVSWSLTSAPAGMTIDSTGLIGWTPQVSDQATSASVTAHVVDSDATNPISYDISFSVDVNNSTPIIANIVNSKTGQGQAFNLNVSTYVTEPNTPVTYSLTQVPAIAPAMTIDPNTGIINWTPSATGGPETVTVKVTDNLGAFATKSFQLTVDGSDLTTMTTALPDAVRWSDYLFRLTAKGGTQPYSWSIISGTLFSGLTLEANTGVIYGTPLEYGTRLLIFRLSDATSYRDIAINFTINTTGLLTTDLPEGTQNQDYAFTLSAFGTKEPYSYSISSGALPAGLTLSSSGNITGVPSVLGDFPITIQVTDAKSVVFSKAFTLTINSPGTMKFKGTTNVGDPSLYKLTYNFTNCAQTGKTGPSQAQVNTAYAGTSLAGLVTSSSGIQLWTVPYSSNFIIEVWGAQGGNGYGTGGLGAYLKGEFALNGGDVLKIIVGQLGTNGGCVGGGGGGSFVVNQAGNVPLIIAGGGGGGYYSSYSGGSAQMAGTTSTTGQTGRDGSNNRDASAGGTNGNGGGSQRWYANVAGGGGGLLTNGVYGPTAQGGFAFVNGGNGGNNYSNSNSGPGGFGGGGGGEWNNQTGAGGGGGYSGGGAGELYGCGGGGGSYNAGTKPSSAAGVNSGHGKVSIKELYVPAGILSSSTNTYTSIYGVHLRADAGPPYSTASGSITCATVKPVSITTWGQIAISDSKASNGGPANTDIKYQVEYWNGSAWVLIPDLDLAGNSTGIGGAGPIDISTLNTVTYAQIRVKANLSTTDTSATPILYSITVTWTP